MTRPDLALLLSCLGVAACAGTPSSSPDPEIERERLEEWRQQRAALEREKDIHLILLNLDKTMDKYVEAQTRSGFERADQLAVGLEDFLRQTVTKNFDALMAIAVQDDDIADQARAVAALGFSQRQEALDPLLSALHSSDSVVVNNAVFALGVLHDPRTPVAAVGAVVEDGARPMMVRTGAAWTLIQLQQTNLHAEQVPPICARLLSDPKTNLDAWILVQALRGVGHSRQREYAALAAPFLEHPTPLVRQAAAIALGYLGDASTAPALLTRIGPDETNPNVRLAARKALQALAGNVDRGYDVVEWRKVFERKREG